jgi:hypothetical protein
MGFHTAMTEKAQAPFPKFGDDGARLGGADIQSGDETILTAQKMILLKILPPMKRENRAPRITDAARFEPRR